MIRNKILALIACLMLACGAQDDSYDDTSDELASDIGQVEQELTTHKTDGGGNRIIGSLVLTGNIAHSQDGLQCALGLADDRVCRVPRTKVVRMWTTSQAMHTQLSTGGTTDQLNGIRAKLNAVNKNDFQGAIWDISWMTNVGDFDNSTGGLEFRDVDGAGDLQQPATDIRAFYSIATDSLNNAFTDLPSPTVGGTFTAQSGRSRCDISFLKISQNYPSNPGFTRVVRHAMMQCALRAKFGLGVIGSGSCADCATTSAVNTGVDKVIIPSWQRCLAMAANSVTNVSSITVNSPQICPAPLAGQ